jgi:hypothetical protein
MGTEDNNGLHLSVVDDGEGPSGKIEILPIENDTLHGKFRQKIVSLQKDIDSSRWYLSEALSEVHDKGLYSQWGYPSWDMYVSTEVGLNVRTAQYLTSLYVWFVHHIGKDLEKEELDEMIEEVRSLGWTKARCLAGVCEKDDWREWIDRAKRMSSSELEAATKKALIKKEGGDPSDVEEMKTFSCKLALEQKDTVDQALELAGTRAESKKKGNLITLICLEFLTDNMAEDKGVEVSREKMIRRIAAMYQIDLIAVDPESKKVLVGKDILSRITKANEKKKG